MFDEGHIPGATFVDLEHDLSAPEGPGRHPLPDPATFASRLGELGFGTDARDRRLRRRRRDGRGAPLVDARRARPSRRPPPRWRHRGLGRGRRAARDVERAASRPSSLDAGDRVAGHARSRGDRASAAAAGSSSTCELASATAARSSRSTRSPGHIPGAVSLPATTLLDEDKRLLSPGELRRRLAGVTDGVDGTELVVSCGSGVTACLGVLAARVAGLPDAILYPGSYSDWSRSGMPIATGALPDEPASR